MFHFKSFLFLTAFTDFYSFIPVFLFLCFIFRSKIFLVLFHALFEVLSCFIAFTDFYCFFFFNSSIFLVLFHVSFSDFLVLLLQQFFYFLTSYLIIICLLY